MLKDSEKNKKKYKKPFQGTIPSSPQNNHIYSFAFCHIQDLLPGISCGRCGVSQNGEERNETE